jgi:hypothetical protein
VPAQERNQQPGGMGGAGPGVGGEARGAHRSSARPADRTRAAVAWGQRSSK